MAQPCDPEGKDLRMKLRYGQLNEKWKSKYGWPIFLPLKPEDVHFFQNLRIPLNNSQSEFDLQILALAKVLIDALNEQALKKNAKTEPTEAAGIKRFSAFLHEAGFTRTATGIDCLKLIQGLRSSGVAHMKGANYEKLTRKLGLAERELRAFLGELLQKVTDFLEGLISQIDREKPSGD
jgi:hypothetical protein